MHKEIFVQKIKSGPRAGKTSLLKAMALGGASRGLSVAVIVPSPELSSTYLHAFSEIKTAAEVVLLTYHEAFVRRALSKTFYNLILLDDCDLMDFSEGDPVDLAEQICATRDWPATIVGMYSGLPETNEKPMETQKHIDLLGLKATDVVTGYSGVATSLSFDLYGCIQIALTPPIDEKGEASNGRWFDVTRLRIDDDTPVMERPDFSQGYIAQGKKGCADKPLP